LESLGREKGCEESDVNLQCLFIRTEDSFP
jgi:hypothetical protein